MRLLPGVAHCLVGLLARGVEQLQKPPMLPGLGFALPVRRELGRLGEPSRLFQEARAAAPLALLVVRHLG